MNFSEGLLKKRMDDVQTGAESGHESKGSHREREKIGHGDLLPHRSEEIISRSGMRQSRMMRDGGGLGGHGAEIGNRDTGGGKRARAKNKKK